MGKRGNSPGTLGKIRQIPRENGSAVSARPLGAGDLQARSLCLPAFERAPGLLTGVTLAQPLPLSAHSLYQRRVNQLIVCEALGDLRVKEEI